MGGAGDLIAARTNDDGVLIVERVLCREGPEFRKCTKSYEIGVFDAETGLKLDGHLEPTSNGIQINVVDYREIESGGTDQVGIR